MKMAVNIDKHEQPHEQQHEKQHEQQQREQQKEQHWEQDWNNESIDKNCEEVLGSVKLMEENVLDKPTATIKNTVDSRLDKA